MRADSTPHTASDNATSRDAFAAMISPAAAYPTGSSRPWTIPRSRTALSPGRSTCPRFSTPAMAASSTDGRVDHPLFDLSTVMVPLEPLMLTHSDTPVGGLIDTASPEVFLPPVLRFVVFPRFATE